MKYITFDKNLHKILKNITSPKPFNIGFGLIPCFYRIETLPNLCNSFVNLLLQSPQTTENKVFSIPPTPYGFVRILLYKSYNKPSIFSLFTPNPDTASHSFNNGFCERKSDSDTIWINLLMHSVKPFKNIGNL